jgi:hypothetical protein
MKGLEIIVVHIPVGLDQHVAEDLCAVCREVREASAADADVYANGDFPGDLAIILPWEAKSFKGERTVPGNTLSAALKYFGVVDHSVWIKVEQFLR